MKGYGRVPPGHGLCVGESCLLSRRTPPHKYIVFSSMFSTARLLQHVYSRAPMETIPQSFSRFDNSWLAIHTLTLSPSALRLGPLSPYSRRVFRRSVAAAESRALHLPPLYHMVSLRGVSPSDDTAWTP